MKVTLRHKSPKSKQSELKAFVARFYILRPLVLSLPSYFRIEYINYLAYIPYEDKVIIQIILHVKGKTKIFFIFITTSLFSYKQLS